MFGGGAKKEKKEEPEGETEDRSGSSKAKKDAEAAEAEEGGEVSFPFLFSLSSYHAPICYLVITTWETDQESTCSIG